MKLFSKMKRPGAMLAGIFSLALASVVLLCGAGSVPIENFSPQGAMQADLNAGGHNLTNIATVSATNVVVSGSLSAANLGSAATNAASAFAPAGVPAGNTLYVDHVNGSDSTGTPGLPQMPYKTISAAISAATAPALVSVRTGTYTEVLNLVNGVNLHLAAGAVVAYAPTNGGQPGIVYSSSETSVIDGEGSFVETGTLGDGTVFNVSSGTLTVHCHAITSAQAAILVGGTAPAATIVCDGPSVGTGEQGSGYLYYQAQSMYGQFGYNSYGNSSTPATEIINCPSITVPAGGGGDIFDIGGPCAMTIYGNVNCAYDGVHLTPEESLSPSGYVGSINVYGNVTAEGGGAVYCESGTITVHGNVSQTSTSWSVIGDGDGIFNLGGTVNVYGNDTAICPDVTFNGHTTILGTRNALSSSGGAYLGAFNVTTGTATWSGATSTLTLSASNGSVAVGQPVVGTNIPSSPVTTVASISGTTLVLSQATTGSGSAQVLTFLNAGTVNNGAQWLVANPIIYNNGVSNWWGYGDLLLGTGTITLSGPVTVAQGEVLDAAQIGGVINNPLYSAAAGIVTVPNGSDPFDLGGNFNSQPHGNRPWIWSNGTGIGIDAGNSGGTIYLGFNGALTAVEHGLQISNGNSAIESAGHAFQNYYTTLAASGAANPGLVTLTGTTATQTATLPSPATAGLEIVIKNQSSQTWTISSASGSQIIATGATTASATISLSSGTLTRLWSDGTNWNQQ